MDIDLNNSIYSTYASLKIFRPQAILGTLYPVSYTHLRAHET